MATSNTIFALFAASNPVAIDARLAETTLSKFPFLSLKTSDNSWFLLAPASTTTQEVSDSLGITDGTSGTAILVRVENYYGRADKAVWEWLAAKQGVALGTASV